MNLDPATAERYLRHAFGQMLVVADRLGDERVNLRPHGESTNAVAALVVHSCGVAEFWLGHVGLGRASDRDRTAEFTSTATVAELHDLVEATLTRVAADLVELEAGRGVDSPWRHHLLHGDTSDASIVVHVIEEAYQHLGHMELAADALHGPQPPAAS